MKEKESKKIEIINADMKKENEYCSYVSENDFNNLLRSLIDNISQKAMYEVNIDKESFINDCIKALNDNIHTKSKYFTEGTEKITIDKQKGAKMQDESKKIHEVS